MKLYRFSPIKDKAHLLEAIRYIHFEAYRLCQLKLGRYYPNAGNMGVFCHYNDEYEMLTKIRQEMTESSDSFNQKYFRLHEPIVFPAERGVPETAYTYLYIRKSDPYRHHAGDVDFYPAPEEYRKMKENIVLGKMKIPGVRVFPRTDLDMIELFDPDIDVLSYISTHHMTETVRKKQSDTTNL